MRLKEVQKIPVVQIVERVISVCKMKRKKKRKGGNNWEKKSAHMHLRKGMGKN